MKEITRIHIAKIPYDIEINAKKDIEKYIDSLERYARDDELLKDIEIRITEILNERGVLENGIITTDDVVAVKNQLGDPKDFLGDESGITEFEATEDTKRKLYRNVDSAILGGVLSGIASYFNVETLWVRLGYLLLFFVSGGTLFMAYVAMWVLIPPAKTATEKLQMSGRPVTLNSIRVLNEDEPKKVVKYERAGIIRRILSVISGSILMLLSLMVVIAMIMVTIGAIHFNVWNSLPVNNGWEYVSAGILFMIAGALLAMLFAIGSYASFVRKFTSKMAISIVSIIALGILVFSTAIGMVAFQTSDQIQNNMKESSINIPVGFANITSMNVDAKSMDVKYVVDTTSHISVKSLSGNDQPVITIAGSVATIKFRNDTNKQMFNLQSTLTIYGPKLDSLIVNNGDVSYLAKAQDMTITADGAGSNVTLNQGSFTNLSLKAENESSIDASAATITNVSVDQKTDSHVILGTVKQLSVTQPVTCASDVVTDVEVESVISGNYRYNSSDVVENSHKSNCGSVTINQ